MTEKIAVFATLRARPGMGDEVARVMEAMFEPVEAEEGTEVYALHRVNGDPDTILFYELYTDGDALGAHSASEAMKAVGAGLGDLLAARAEIVLAAPVRAKGLTL